MPHFFERIGNRSIEGNILKLIFNGNGELKSLDFDLRDVKKEATQEVIDASAAVIGHYDNSYNYRTVFLKVKDQ